jgi:RNA polymerase-binding transcription factor DksA
MSTSHPLSKVQRSALMKALQLQLESLKRRSGAKLEDMSQAQHAYQTSQQDVDDATQRLGDDEVEATVSDMDSREFNALTQALQRIHGADYGLCVDCHVPIAFERLQLAPQAMRCTTCQTLQERTL